jgi:hypothetical protein
LLPGNDPPCAPRQADANRLGACFDVFAQLSLNAGNYILALTQEANEPLGNLSDGFFYINIIPDQNFNNGFVDAFGQPGDGHWALDISGVDSAAQLGAATPEPATGLMAAGVLLIGFFKFRRKCNALNS